jgi:phthiocerol/phenolphthiocerol synthesis type-I polyketide synthase E
VLGRPDIPPDGNFFDLGGDSLLLARVLQLLNHRLQVELTFVALLRHTSAQGLAHHVEQRRCVQPAAPATRAPKGRGLLSRMFAVPRAAGKAGP